jgi:hypothetical protein
MDRRGVDLKLLRNDLRQSGPQAGSEIDMTMKSRDTGVIPNRNQGLKPLARITRNKGGLTGDWRRGRQRFPNNQ